MPGKIRTKEQLLASVPLFAECSKRELARIASLADRADVQPGRALTREGTVGREFFVVADGKADVSIRGKSVAVAGPGDFFGEMSLLDRAPRSATVVAQTPMTLYVVDARSFATLLDESPVVARSILKVMAQRLRLAEKAPTH